jgi:hypothetical protein
VNLWISTARVEANVHVHVCGIREDNACFFLICLENTKFVDKFIHESHCNKIISS